MENRLLNVDFKECIKNIEDCSIDLIVTDPPYKVTSRGNAGNSGGMLKSKEFLNGTVFKHNQIKISEFMPDLFRVLKEGTHCYIMTNHKNLIEMLCEAEKVGFKFIKSLIWNKGNKIMGHYYMSQFEYILMFRKGKAKMINKCGTADILDVPNKKTKVDGKNIHDTEKPVRLMEILVENSSNENDVVFDPFAGVGSTLIASKNLNRRYMGFEIDKNYYRIAKERIENAKDI